MNTMTYGTVARRVKRMVLIVIIGIVLLLGLIGYTVFGMLNKAGMFVSPSSANASSLYQLYPFEMNGKYYFISVEGVFKTSTYEQNGGIINRSGSTSYRLGLYSLDSGVRMNRLVTSDNYNEKIKVIGKAGNKLWCYSTKDGLHSRTIPALTVDITTDKIISANKDLAAGLAKGDKYFTNIDELFTTDEQSNALMVTTIDGRSIWLDTKSFATVPQPAYGVARNKFTEFSEKIKEAAVQGEKVDTTALAARIRVLASDLDHTFFNYHTSVFVQGADGCNYQLEGSTLSNLVKSNCPRNNDDTNDNTEATAKKQFINGSFLVNEIVIAGHAPLLPINGPTIATQDDKRTMYILNKNKISPDAHILISKYDTKKEQTTWQYDPSVHFTSEPTIKSTYVLNNLLIIVFKVHPELDDNFSCIAIDKMSGKEAWQFMF